MQTMPQHACDACNELRGMIVGVKERVMAAKRLGSLAEMQGELMALQFEVLAVEQKAIEVKAFVTCSVALQAHEEAEARGTREEEGQVWCEPELMLRPVR